MKILYTFLNFNGLTGSELYYYELAREMRLKGHDITIASNHGGVLTDKSIENGIKCIGFMDIKNFNDFDIIHCSHRPIFAGFLSGQYKKLPPVIATIHSELLELENPDAYRNKIDHFITIRPSIKSRVSLPEEKTSLIYNPIDLNRFNDSGITDQKYIFFPGTINYLRMNAIMDVASIYSSEYQIIAMGSNEYPNFRAPWLTIYDSVFNIEDIIKGATFVCGIIKGRTYMESVFCGKTYLDYQVNEKGEIYGISYNAPGECLSFGRDHVHKSEFNSSNVANKIEEIYNQYI
jgi:hypothetical protein